jgi:methylenetetrahydrofolate dehydrogenase (NADP+)/methenyltetrahydrofolate cyclohydrolase
MQIIEGKKIAQRILNEVKTGVAKLPYKPVFCDCLVGEDSVSKQYVKMKAKAAEKCGFKFRNADFPENISTNNLIAEIKKISQEPNMCGMIVQLPLPEGFNKQEILDSIDPKIDVDCTGKVNAGLFYQGKGFLEFPTAKAVMAILDSLQVELKEKKFLVVGQGELVGRPVSFLLRQRGLAVETADKYTTNISELMSAADVIVSAAGKAKLITGQKIKPGSIIIDAGTSESDGGIVGDVDSESVKDVADFVSPVPGGVGPVTVAELLVNVLKVAKQKVS